MKEDGRATYRISEAARELGISIEWLRKGEARGFFPPALRDRNDHRYYTEEDREHAQQAHVPQDRGTGQRVSRSQWRRIRPFRDGRGVTEECEQLSMRNKITQTKG